MKSWKKLVAITGAIAMMSALFAGCGEKAPANQESSKPSESKVQESSKPAESSQVSEPVEEEFTYPMTDCPEWTTLTVCTSGTTAVYGEANLNLTEWAKEVKARTGANFTFEHLAVWDDASVNLLATEQSYPEVVERYMSAYTGSTAGEDGICVPLEDLIAEYMPNLTALMEEYPEIRMSITNADGHIYGLPSINTSSETGHVAYGLILRTDWLEECGLEMPKTVDDLYNVLKTFKEKYNATVVTQTTFITGGTFRDAFEANGDFAYDENGDIYYTWATDGYREMISTVAKWYEEGLIHKDFLTFNSTQVRTAALAGETGCFWGYGGSTMTTLLQEADATGVQIEVAAVPALTAEKDGIVKFNCNSDPITASPYTIITNKCDPELYPYICRYYDWLYSEEGIILGNFGIEGKSYTMVDGKPTFTKTMTHNEDGYTVDQMMAQYCRNHSNGFVGVQTYEYLYQYYGRYPAAVDAIATWSFENRENSTSNKVASFTQYYTEDEKELVDEIKVDLSTYVTEMRAKFIYGELDIDDDAVWDEYVKQTRKLRVNEYIDIVTDAMDRKIEAYAEYGIDLGIPGK